MEFGKEAAGHWEHPLTDLSAGRYFVLVGTGDPEEMIAAIWPADGAEYPAAVTKSFSDEWSSYPAWVPGFQPVGESGVVTIHAVTHISHTGSNS